MVKYAADEDKARIRECFESIPRQLAKENKKFQYSVVKKGVARLSTSAVCSGQIMPDVHGRELWKKAVESAGNDDSIVFVGYYLSQYSAEKDIYGGIDSIFFTSFSVNNHSISHNSLLSRLVSRTTFNRILWHFLLSPMLRRNQLPVLFPHLSNPGNGEKHHGEPQQPDCLVAVNIMSWKQ